MKQKELHKKYVQNPQVKEHLKEYAKEYCQRDYVKAKAREYIKNRRKTEEGYIGLLRTNIKKRGTGDISYNDLFDLMTKNNTCYYCGKPIYILGKEKTIDHKNPTSKGGTNDLNNLVVCCRHCNFTKRDMNEKEYFEYMRKKEIARD